MRVWGPAIFSSNYVPLKDMEQIVGVAQLYFMPHPLLEIVQRLMAHPVVVEKIHLYLPHLD